MKWNWSSARVLSFIFWFIFLNLFEKRNIWVFALFLSLHSLHGSKQYTKVITFVIPSHLTYELLRKHREKFSKASGFNFSVILSWRCWNPKTSNFYLVFMCFVGCFFFWEKTLIFRNHSNSKHHWCIFLSRSNFSKKKLAWKTTESFKDDTWLKR